MFVFQVGCGHGLPGIFALCEVNYASMALHSSDLSMVKYIIK